jgi:NADH dehydrogenase [ubiquinone] 1 alpha subcomplex assembly factor 2
MDHLKGKVTPFRQAYLQWRSLRNVPFRKKFFIGYDLDGNTYWEFFNPNNPDRARRIVEYRDTKLNWVDYEAPPQWVQWLRYARPHHPSLDELYGDKVRQMQIKEKVRQAEARWRSVPLVDKSSGAAAGGVAGIGAVGRALGMNVDLSAAGQQQLNDGQAQQQQQQPQQHTESAKSDKHANPPKPIERHNPSEGFQPVAWSQKPIKRG